MTDISKLKVPELKTELKKRGGSTGGNKKDLFEKFKKVSLKKKKIYFQKIFFLF
jgi:hypothetical protein